VREKIKIAMKRWKHCLWLLAVGVPGSVGSLIALCLGGSERWLFAITLGAMLIYGPGIFLVGLFSLLGTRTFLRNAVSAKGGVRAIYEMTPTGINDGLFFSSRIVTVQFWTEQEESIDFQSHTVWDNPEIAVRSIPVLYDPDHPSEARINSFEGLWFTSGLVIVIGAGLLLTCTVLFMSVLR
jgi:hypothetical protein